MNLVVSPTKKLDTVRIEVLRERCSDSPRRDNAADRDEGRCAGVSRDRCGFRAQLTVWSAIPRRRVMSAPHMSVWWQHVNV
jgi:hypothetical protein